MRAVTCSALAALLCSLPGAASAQDDGEQQEAFQDLGDDVSARSTGRVRLMAPREVPPSYGVQRGDTLWAITGHFYGNPWEWPRVWSYNPEITNPHWIYPQQVVRLLPEGSPASVVAPGVRARVVVRRAPREGTVYLRERGWLDEDALETAGVIVGSPEDHMLLSPYDRVYVRFDDLPDGQSEPSGELTVFRRIERDERTEGEEGTLVRILGTLRVEDWDPERRIATAMITEALEPIERGYHVAAVPRRFETVPPIRAEMDLETRIVAVLDPTELVSSQQIVFVPVGEEDGVRMGHRFVIVTAGDAWRDDLESSEQESTTVPPPDRLEEYPEEVIAEGRVVALRPHSAGILITNAVDAIEVGARARMRQGY